MNVTAIDRAIRILCAEVQGSAKGMRDWQQRTEEELLCEACVCMFGSQTVFEVAEAAADRLKKRGLLRASIEKFPSSEYERHISATLSEPLKVKLGGKPRDVRLRFKNRFASLLATTVNAIYPRGQSLRKILLSAGSAREARECLIEWVWGFGPKQASLFLRRVGYCADLAVLDTHILDYLRLARGINLKPGTLSRLASYELIENEFRQMAVEFGHPVGCVDLAMWVTMRVAKRESIW